MRGFFNDAVSKSWGLLTITGIVLLCVLILPIALILILLVCSKPLTEEEKKKYQLERKKVDTSFIRSHCGCCSGSHRQISYIN
jgi:hypothetical protein